MTLTNLIVKTLKINKADILIKSISRFPQRSATHPAPIRIEFLRAIDRSIFKANLKHLKTGPAHFKDIRITADRPALLNKECELVEKAATLFRRDNPGFITKFVFVVDKPRMQVKKKAVNPKPDDPPIPWKMLTASEQKQWIDQVYREEGRDDDDDSDDEDDYETPDVNAPGTSTGFTRQQPKRKAKRPPPQGTNSSKQRPPPFTWTGNSSRF